MEKRRYQHGAIRVADRSHIAQHPLAIILLLNLHLRDRNNAGEYLSLRRKTFLTLCAGLGSFAIFLTIASHFTGKRADFANPTGVSEQQWQGQIDDLRVNRRALASAIGTCERSVDDRLSDGRVLQGNIEQLALELGVPPGQAIRAFCGRFFDTVLDQKMSLKDYTRAMAAQPSEVMQTLIRP